MKDLQLALGTQSNMTVRRKLSELPYLISYSDHSKYTLRTLCQFDANGLWTDGQARFSRFGSLAPTCQHLVEQSEAGMTAMELKALLKVGPRQVLKGLWQQSLLKREWLNGTLVYLSPQRAEKRQQWARRRQQAAAEAERKEREENHEFYAALDRFYGLLDERQRRCYAGLESLKHGEGGDAKTARELGMDPQTVARGRQQLLTGELGGKRLRKPGGGRPSIKKTPQIIDQIEELMKSEVAGDPVRDLRWTRKTTMKIAGELTKLDIKVGARTVAKLLKSMGFSLKTARKSLLSGIQTGPEYRNQRNQQVRKIEKMRANFTTAGLPVISIDCKKKELIGRFKNAGKVLCRKAREVLDHDYRSDAIGTAVPYGIYDVNRNHGTVMVGDSRETAAFASDALERWWVLEGRQAYPDAKSLLVLADCGGGNGARVRAWKRALQGKMADRYGLSIIVCHWPPGASKWNPIEHRLFSQISRNWAGVTLESYETVLNYIGTTTTDKGLTVRAVMHSQQYETGERVSDTEMKSLRCRKHKELPKWNYTIEPGGNFAKIAA